MEEISTRLLVIGGGPGGYVAAIRAGQLGIDTVLVEQAKLGGTCLNVGCIPSKALIGAAQAFHAARLQQTASSFGLSVENARIDFARTIAWKDGIVGRLTGGVGQLLKKAKVKSMIGRAEFLDGKTCLVHMAEGAVRVHAEHIVIATGSEPVELKSLPFGDRILSSTEALSLASIPDSLVVIGAGYIGLELGTAYAKLGSNVSVVESAERILPAWDAELTAPVARTLAELGVKVLTGAVAQGLSANGQALIVRQGDVLTELPAEKIMVAAGRKACTTGFGLERLDLRMDGQFVKIDDRCATSMRNVWAIGDVTGGLMLAHRAMAQGVVVAEVIAGQRKVFDHVAIPAICFTDPEIVSVGMLPDEAGAAGLDVVVAKFPFAANGRAITQDNDRGFVRVVARADDHLVVGIQAVGADVAELSAAFGLALEMGARLEDIASTIHAHPTRGEAFLEAALGGMGHMLHL